MTPNFMFGGSADGAGYLKNPDGKGYIALVNHEDNFAVSRITLDETFKPVKGEYILNSDGGLWRLCSATLATPKVHGFGPSFITCGESGPESQIHALSPFASPNDASINRVKPALGQWSAENAVPLPKEAYAGKTVIVIGDDDFQGQGQLALYLAQTGDLENGTVYAVKRKDGVRPEMDMKVGQSYPVEFVQLDKNPSAKQIAAKAEELSTINFGRVEDIDYRKGQGANNREIYFNVTGQDYTASNADKSKTKYGRVYRLVLDANDPLKGTLSVVLDGDDRNSKAGLFQNPDNITLTRNYAYIQEDPNGYGDETHDAYIYQYNLNTGALQVVFEADHRRDKADALLYNPKGASDKGDWEYGALEDISDLIGVPNTFALCIQPHTWRADKYKNPDGGSLRKNENQASQIVIIKGLPK
jgi:secreted PhoX family phosphatase